MTSESPTYTNKVGHNSEPTMENGGENYAVGKPPTSKRSSVLRTILQLAVCVVCGFIFGLSLEKARGKERWVFWGAVLSSDCH